MNGVEWGVENLNEKPFLTFEKLTSAFSPR